MRRMFQLFKDVKGSISTEYALVVLAVALGIVLMHAILERAIYSYTDVFHFMLSLPVP